MELLVVLVVIGLALGLVMPNLSRQYDSLQHRQTMDDVLEAVRHWPAQAQELGREIELPVRAEPWAVADLAGLGLKLPEGWRARVRRPLRLLPSGVCLGGELELLTESESTVLVLNAPYCQPERQGES